MSDRLKPYNQDALFFFPLISAGANDFDISPTIAAGDAKLFTDKQIFTNIATESVAFTSGSEEPTSGDQLDGATSGADATFMYAVVSGGTWGGGDAQGVLFLKGVSATDFQSENLNINGGTANVMSIGAAPTAGAFGKIGNGSFCVALTAAEMQCGLGTIHIIDSATKEWEDQAIEFSTFGNAAAAMAFDLNSARTDVGKWLGTAVTLGNGAPDVNIQSTDDIDLSTTQKASVQTEADTALASYDGPTDAEMQARTLVAASYFDPTADAVANVTTVGSVSTKTGYALAATGADLILKDSTFALAIADALYDEATAGHTTAGTFGKAVIDVLADTNELQSDDVPGLIAAVGARLPAALIGGRMNSDMNALNGQTGAATRLERWMSAGHHGTAQGGAAGSITLNASADALDNFYRGSTVAISNGTGKKQYRLITGYNGTTKVATVFPDWIVNPASGTEYATIPLGMVDVRSVAGTTQTSGDLAALIAGLNDPTAQAIADLILPKKNTALSNIEFLMVASSDHVTPKTGLSLTVTRSIDGGAFGSGTGTAAEVANGIYQYDASQADMNGTIITFRFTGTAADDRFITIRTGGV